MPGSCGEALRAGCLAQRVRARARPVAADHAAERAAALGHVPLPTCTTVCSLLPPAASRPPGCVPQPGPILHRGRLAVLPAPALALLHGTGLRYGPSASPARDAGRGPGWCMGPISTGSSSRRRRGAGPLCTSVARAPQGTMQLVLLSRSRSSRALHRRLLLLAAGRPPALRAITEGLGQRRAYRARHGCPPAGHPWTLAGGGPASSRRSQAGLQTAGRRYGWPSRYPVAPAAARASQSRGTIGWRRVGARVLVTPRSTITAGTYRRSRRRRPATTLTPVPWTRCLPPWRSGPGALWVESAACTLETGQLVDDSKWRSGRLSLRAGGPGRLLLAKCLND
mmetsp:Transcript_19489/g.65409  ORF Transcript_19489/g.65409 Transcript_19489/m.65409 type:complete len:339 (+) Transcript_19489:356-1372(+)